MQTGELVELAAIVSEHGSALALGPDALGIHGLEDYWAASKCRFERWGRALHRIRLQETPVFEEPGSTVRGLIEEILGSEVLTRVWTAAVTAFDRRRDAQDNEIVARSVFIGHQEMRHRVLKLLVTGPGVPSTEAVELNRLRRRAELWTDLLLAPLLAQHDVCEFGFEDARLKRFATNLKEGALSRSGPCDVGALASASLLTSIRHSFDTVAPNPDMNARVAASVLGAFAAPHFDSCGVFRSLWMLRLATTADDTERLITDMFRADALGIDMPKSNRFG
ncbi:MAG: hypothetical protein K8U03_08095 [Planctomycetia bacterium]|nr:hypothetical protein [Planctomycetia bacterium]